MANVPTLPEIGRIVEVTRGRDQGLVAVVVGQVADRFVYIADGLKRPIAKPKKKNVLHVRSTRQLAAEVADQIARTGAPTDAQLRFAVNQYLASLASAGTDSEEGVRMDGQGRCD
ncbi:MAG: KOW domain-containing RNA-binding protein [Alicyclobacillus sp.]|nr:KOW domain-containing RNA-binding protein [Alicyclobacillus sp.]